jgi:hypothetical protein
MRDGSQRAAIHREENAVANTQLDSFLAYLGDTAPADPPEFPYARECSTLGCVVEVPMRPAAYRSAGTSASALHTLNRRGLGDHGVRVRSL